MTTTKKTTPAEVKTKPYMSGSAFDQETMKKSIIFFGSLVMVFFLILLICSMATFDQIILRAAVNLIVEAAVILVFYNNGISHGTNAVSRGEIAWQSQEKGREISPAERKLCYHPMKGFLIGLLGTMPFLILGLILAVTTKAQTASQGTVPSWLQGYLGRSEIGGALVAYTEPKGLDAMDMIRIIVRIAVLPFINLVGASNYGAVLWVERLSPLIILVPAISYGLGYTRGPSVRSRVLTEIAENAKKRQRRERKERRMRRMGGNNRREPEQLN